MGADRTQGHRLDQRSRITAANRSSASARAGVVVLPASCGVGSLGERSRSFRPWAAARSHGQQQSADVRDLSDPQLQARCLGPPRPGGGQPHGQPAQEPAAVLVLPRLLDPRTGNPPRLARRKAADRRRVPALRRRGSPGGGRHRGPASTCPRSGPNHPGQREAARITRDNLAAGADAATFCWFSESRHGPVEFPAERSGDATAGRGEPAAQPHLLRRAVVGARVAATRHDQPAAGLPPPARPPRAAHGNQLPSATACSGCAHTRARRPGGAVGRLLPGPARRRGATRPAPWHEGRSIQPQVDFWLYAEQYLANKDGWEISL